MQPNKKIAFWVLEMLSVMVVPANVDLHYLQSYQPSRDSRNSPGNLGLVPTAPGRVRARQNSNDVPELTG